MASSTRDLLPFLSEFSFGDNKLGKGGSSVVMEGRHVPSNKPVAIKIIDPLRRTNPEQARKLFIREVNMHKAASSVEGVIRMLGNSSPTSKGRCYLATELAAMGDLCRLLKRRTTLPESVVREVILQLVTTVTGLHRKTMVHRDIKPENIFLEPKPLRSSDYRGGFVVKLGDFGHAECMPAGNKLLYTRDCGTPGYKAPELRSGWKHGHGLVADMWSVGMVMNDLFELESRQSREASMADGSFWNKEVWRSVSDNAKDLLHRLLNPNPGTRITAEQALQHPWLQGAPKRIHRKVWSLESPVPTRYKGATRPKHHRAKGKGKLTETEKVGERISISGKGCGKGEMEKSLVGKHSAGSPSPRTPPCSRGINLAEMHCSEEKDVHRIHSSSINGDAMEDEGCTVKGYPACIPAESVIDLTSAGSAGNEHPGSQTGKRFHSLAYDANIRKDGVETSEGESTKRGKTCPKLGQNFAQMTGSP